MQLSLDAGTYDPDRRAVVGASGEISLTPTEARLLEYLAERAGKVIAQKQLLTDVWGYSARVESRTLYTTVNRLRQKIERDPSFPRHLVAVQGAGYRLDVPEVAPAPAAAPVAAPAARVEPPHGPSVGRDRELGDVAARLAGGTRVLTLTGPGGVGKSHLARRLAAGWDGPAWFVDVSDAVTAAEVEAALGRALDLPVGADVPAALSGRGAALVVLDCFERAVEAAAATVGHWAANAGEARFLVTSREALQIGAEQRVLIEPLAPAAAASLFSLRARAVRPDFAAVPDDVAAIVKALDGLPLAVELAAARANVLTTAQLRQRLSQGLDVLASSRRDLPERQRSLRAALDASWELLTPWERAALAQASVFVGGMTLDAAEAVLDLRAFADAPDVLDVVQALLDKSLLRFVDGDDVRFAMYDSVRFFADEKLAAGGPAARADAWRRHLAWASRLGQDASLAPLSGPRGVELRRALHEDLPNLLAAVDRGLSLGDGERAAWAARAALVAMESRRPFGEGIALAQRVLDAAPALPPDARWRLRVALAANLRAAGHADQAAAVMERSMAEDLGSGDPRAEGRVLVALGSAHRELMRLPEARNALVRATGLLRAVGDEPGEADAWGQLGAACSDAADIEGLQQAQAAELRLARRMGDRWREAVVIGNMAYTHVARGEFPAALAKMDEALALHRAVGNRRAEGAVLSHLGQVLYQSGDPDGGRAALQRSLAIQRELGERRYEAYVLLCMGLGGLTTGRLDEAREALEASLAMHRAMRQRRFESILHCNLADLHLLQGRVDQAEQSARLALEIALEMQFPPDIGASRAVLAEILGRRGLFDEARRQLDLADEAIAGTPIAAKVTERRAIVEKLAADQLS
jgi:predicted ATPase/DNA-binding winged helix-turn-helix (wHTH) protein